MHSNPGSSSLFACPSVTKSENLSHQVGWFSLTGAVGVSHHVFTGLELKHIQLDTLGHILTRHVPTCAHFATQSTLYGNTLKFFTGNYKEASLFQFSYLIIEQWYQTWRFSTIWAYLESFGCFFFRCIYCWALIGENYYLLVAFFP